jgi:hypothetical protein
VTDLAGNSGGPSNVVIVKIDKTSPTATLSQTPPANALGWNTSDVAVIWNWDDANGSGVDPAKCPSLSAVTGQAPSLLKQPVWTPPATRAPQRRPSESTEIPNHSCSVWPWKTISGLPLITITGTATVKNQEGTTLGTAPFTCWNSDGVGLSLTASDAVSGVASLTYSANGARPIASTTVSGAAARLSVSSHGRTKVTYTATDVAGNKEAIKSETIIVGRAYACATPTPSFTMPDAGTLVINGTATVGGRSRAFRGAIDFD